MSINIGIFLNNFTSNCVLDTECLKLLVQYNLSFNIYIAKTGNNLYFAIYFIDFVDVKIILLYYQNAHDYDQSINLL